MSDTLILNTVMWVVLSYVFINGLFAAYRAMINKIWYKIHDKDCVWYGKESLPCACPRNPTGGCYPVIESDDTVDVHRLATYG